MLFFKGQLDSLVFILNYHFNNRMRLTLSPFDQQRIGALPFALCRLRPAAVPSAVQSALCYLRPTAISNVHGSRCSSRSQPVALTDSISYSHPRS